MFPLRDENPTIHASIVTFLIVAANAVVWIFFQHYGYGAEFIGSICRLGLIPGELLGLVSAGTRIPASRELVCVLDGVANYWTILTSMFAHGGWFHIISNMWFLVVFGDNVEDAMGPVRFLLFYLTCGLSAEAVQVLTHPASALPMVGASGAISGVMGAYAVMYPTAPVQVLVFLGFFFYRIVLPAFALLFYWFFLQVISGLPSLGQEAAGVAFWAHIGGFVTGLLAARLFCHPGRLAQCKRRGRSRFFR